MTPSDEITAQLLVRIADDLGVDVATFFPPNRVARADPEDERAREERDAALLKNLIAAFRALPTDESKRQAVQLLERLAVRAGSLG